MRTLAFVLALSALWLPASASAITCTASDVRVLVRNYNLVAPVPTLVGTVFPVEIAGTSGTFHLNLSGAPEASFEIIAGVQASLRLSGEYNGTIDGAGNVSLPDVAVDFTVVLSTPMLVEGTASMSTGIGGETVSEKDFVVEGSGLDFATGSLRIAGQRLILDAPLSGGLPVLAGLSITCQLDQIPAPASLPVGPTLTGVKAKGRFGKSKSADEVAGDTLSVKALLRPVGAPPDPGAADVFVRITSPAAAEDFMLTRSRPGALVTKGKTHQAVDTDGTTLHLLEGQKRAGAAGAAESGKLTITTRKKGFAVQFTQGGLDLCGFPAGAVLTIQIGSTAASAPITVHPRGKHQCP